jgi:hypothetical protein
MMVGSALVASAQDRDHDRDSNRGRWGWQDRDRDWDHSNQKAFRDGYNDGQKAARHRGNSGKYNNHYRDRDDRQAYDAGYRRGYGSGNGQWSDNRNGDWRNDRDRNNDGRDDRTGHPFGGVLGQQQGNYPNGGYGIGNARGIGFNDGLLAGQKDRSTGNSFRPTQNKGYQDADKGYSSSVGDKNQYKQVYRDGFMQGYQRGYYGR